MQHIGQPMVVFNSAIEIKLTLTFSFIMLFSIINILHSLHIPIYVNNELT